MEKQQKAISKWRKGLLITVGVVSVSLGFIGIFIPLLPTTPFLLLAAACFIRSSERLHHWLMHHKWMGPYIYNYYHHRVMSVRTKVFTLGLLWLTIGYTALMVIERLWVQVLLFIIAVGVTIHLALLRSHVPKQES